MNIKRTLSRINATAPVFKGAKNRKTKKGNFMKHVKYTIGVLLFFLLLNMNNYHYAAERKEGIDAFPSSYQPYLLALQKKYPNWNFIALYTGLDWNYVIDQENQFGKNLVPKSYSDRWKNTNPGEYNVEVDAGWVDASRRAVEYTMDPRNFLNEVRVFQFEGLSYNEKTNHISGVEKILYGTEFYNRIVEYVDSSGSTITMSSKYSDLILKAGQTSQVSSFHLASRIKQEVGPFLTHSSISGTVPGFEGLYNFYNIGATSSSEPMGAIKNGLQYAKDGKGASQETRDKYLIPWNTKERAITGGGIFIGSSYIHLGQDTIYLQKFHVTSNTGGELFWHQYMTNVLAPYSESRAIYNGYANTGLLDDTISFIIPVYNNMPEIPVQNPNILESDFTEDNTKVYADVTSTLNIRTGPSTSYESLTTVDRNVIMTRIAKGKQSGELWDRVVLPDGMMGYAFQSYLKEVPERQIEEIHISIDSTTILKGENKQLKVEILPEEAKNHEVEFSSSNPKVASVDSQGNILGLQSGTTTITVKAKENNVSSQIEITVYTPVTDLQLNTEELVLQEGDKYVVVPIIIPQDASNQNIIYQSENSQIAQIDSSGKITAIKEGETKIIVETETEKIKREISVTVVPRLQEDEVAFEEGLVVNQNEITGWDIQNLKVEQVKEKIETIYEIEIYHPNGKLLSEDENVGTGCKIRLIDENKIIKMEYMIIIYGDVNADGKINSTDLLVLQRHILEIEKLAGVFLQAGNVQKNGKNPTSVDMLKIQRHILGIELIQQI